jgi:hypothetical protein
MTMPSQNLPFMTKTTDLCPSCEGMTRIALVEPHPSLAGLEMHTFACPTCGLARIKIGASPPRRRLLAAR